MEKENCKILLIDDEAELTKVVSEILIKDGYTCIDKAYDLKSAYKMLKENEYHLVLLDVMFSEGNGFDFCERLKSEGYFPNIPLIFLSARDEDRARLFGLGLGADDYITKPFLPKELLLRIGAVLRRTYSMKENGDRVILGETSVFIEGGTVKKKGEEISLTAKELMLFTILYRNRGKIVTTDILCDELWPEGSFGLESSLIVHMRHLREKIEADPSKPEYLKTVRGLGYKLERE